MHCPSQRSTRWAAAVAVVARQPKCRQHLSQAAAAVTALRQQRRRQGLQQACKSCCGAKEPRTDAWEVATLDPLDNPKSQHTRTAWACLMLSLHTRCTVHKVDGCGNVIQLARCPSPRALIPFDPRITSQDRTSLFREQAAVAMNTALFLGVLVAAAVPSARGALVSVYSIQRHGARNWLPKTALLAEQGIIGGPTLLPQGKRSRKAVVLLVRVELAPALASRHPPCMRGHTH